MLDQGALLDVAQRSATCKVTVRRRGVTNNPAAFRINCGGGPLARLDINSYAAYHADFASPLMSVISLAHFFSWTGLRQNLRRHWGGTPRSASSTGRASTETVTATAI